MHTVMVLAGGFESMSGLPFFLPKMRTGYRLGHDRVGVDLGFFELSLQRRRGVGRASFGAAGGP